MKSRLFANSNPSFLSIDFNKFIEAVDKSDNAAIDAMLDARKNGYKLDLDQEINGISGNTALSKALQKHDIEIAAKLIRAGAKTCFEYKEWVADDDSCYPYGGFETRTKNIFSSLNLTHDELMKLMSLATEHTAESACTNRI